MENEQVQEQREETVTIDDVKSQPKQRRARPARRDNSEAKQKETEAKVKRNVKLSGADVQQMFEFCSTLAVQLGAKEFWVIPKKEVAPFSNEMADMLNRIPAQYVTGFFDMGGYLTVGIGLYTVFKPRLDAERQIREAMNGAKNVEEIRQSVPYDPAYQS